MHQQGSLMDLECLRSHTYAPLINESKHQGDMRFSPLLARRRLGGQHAGCFIKGLVCRSSTVCCSSGHERRLTVVETDEFCFGGFSTWRKHHQGLYRLDPLASSLRTGEMMEDGGRNGTVETDQPCNTCSEDKADRMQNSVSSLPGFIYPSTKTVGKSTNIVWQECMVKREERQKILGQKGCVIWITGLSGSGKSTLACTLDHQLYKRGNLSYVLDGDNLRHGLNKNLGFSAEDRAENIRRIGEVARIFVDAGIICMASAISPYRKDRDACRQLLQPGEFIEDYANGYGTLKVHVVGRLSQYGTAGGFADIRREVYMNFPLKLCEERDPKGLYKLARAGKIKGFTGIDDPYEAPIDSEIVMEPIKGRCPTPTEMASRLLSYLEEKGFLGPCCRK